MVPRCSSFRSLQPSTRVFGVVAPFPGDSQFLRSRLRCRRSLLPVPNRPLCLRLCPLVSEDRLEIKFEMKNKIFNIYAMDTYLNILHVNLHRISVKINSFNVKYDRGKFYELFLKSFSEMKVVIVEHLFDIIKS